MARSIAILAPSSVPFQMGGAERFWLGLRQALADLPGLFVELLKLPCREDSFAQIVDSYKTFSEMDLSHFDVVISGKYPAWMVSHHNHILYMLHPLRGLYDTYHFTGLPEKLEKVPAALADLAAILRSPNAGRGDLPAVFELCSRALNTKSLPSSLFAFPGPLVRELVHFMDRAALAPSQISAYLAISDRICQRKDYFPANANVKVLHPPSDISGFFCGEGKYAFTASRLNSMKRIHLIVDAMAYVGADISLKIAGTGPELEHLRRRAQADPRIEFLGHVPDAELPALYANAIFTPFAPYDEDYGLIVLEAMKSGKPVISLSDSGGALELIEDGVNGFVVEPTAAALGAAMDKLARNPALARKMGEAAIKSVERVNWPETVSALLGHAAAESAARRDNSRKNALVCAPFPADREGHGGQRRVFFLCEELAREFAVLLVCPGAKTQRTIEVREIAPGFKEISLPWPGEILETAERLRRETGASCDDLALARHCGEWDDLRDILKRQSGAFCAILSHPWLHAALRRALPRIPLVYDAQNVETDLKAALFAKNPELAVEAASMEEQCARDAALLFACSNGDIGRLSALGQIPIGRMRLVPNGYDAENLKFMDKAERLALRRSLAYPDAKLALFSGSGHGPNLEAVEFIIRLAAEMPEVEFLIAGSAGTQEKVRRIKRPVNVHLLGLVPENIKNLLLYAADAGLNPVTSGSGTNLKIIEYMAAGLETLSTPFGARGMDGEIYPAVHLAELADFAAQLRAIFASPAKDAELSAIARRIARDYAWRETMRPVCGLLLTGEKNRWNFAHAPAD